MLSNPMQAMWMGPRGGEVWMPSPDAGGVFTPIGWGSNSNSPVQQLGGGASMRRSKTTHKDYPMSWTIGSRMQFAPLLDMYSGARGPGLIYFIDLMAADINILPEQWAFPASACYDGVPLLGSAPPANTGTPTNTNSYPPETAQYTLPNTGAVTLHPLYIPIPPGYSAWVGIHGTIGGGTGGIRVTPILPGNTATTAVMPTMIPVTSNVVVNTQFDSTTYQGIVLDILDGTAGTLNLSSMVVQILQDGVTPSTGGFIGGIGNSGCEFVSAPVITSYSSIMDQVGAAAHLVEIGDWM